MKAGHLFDLPDFLTMKSTGKLSRSLCSLVSKWMYINDGVNQSWNEEYYTKIGLGDLSFNDWGKVGREVFTPGEKVGVLTTDAASELGLAEGTCVGCSLIDAHSGALAMIAAGVETEEELSGRLAVICGTSTCHVLLNKKSVFLPGIWGPYLNTVLPEFWVYEGGQSATGALVDYLINNHPAKKECPTEDVYGFLEELLQKMSEKRKLIDISYLTYDLHLYPDFYGNRSPLADPSMKGMICGLTLDNSIESLALLYLAAIQSFAYGTRDIRDTFINAKLEVNSVLMCGGLVNSSLFIQLHADVLAIPVLITEKTQTAVVGAAILGAAASDDFESLVEASLAIAGDVKVYSPQRHMIEYHNKKYTIFKKMQQDQLFYRKRME